ncbi:Fucose 4-O-acetylase and related acetyltransferases [Weissella viridescens]|uniref:Fucose 4-O-acetylase and related acetyltransferases n=1 Tax=Weissella viridescens TaxID=1629 RepID=A0A380P2H1_WEIVI|nr:Fucose 4-O-acetylase and related acetyltransferases [Weissella viridescens]
MAILLVVFGHAVQGINSSEHLGFTTAWSSIYITKAVIYSFHMPAFFILSGLLSIIGYKTNEGRFLG